AMYTVILLTCQLPPCPRFPWPTLFRSRIPIAAIRFGKHLVDHRDGGRAGAIGVLEIAAGQNGNLHGGEEGRSDAQNGVVPAGRRSEERRVGKEWLTVGWVIV